MTARDLLSTIFGFIVFAATLWLSFAAFGDY